MITHKFTAYLKRVEDVDVDVPVPVTLAYDTATDPFAVQAIFEISDDEDRVWHFGHELLRIGAYSLTPYGRGDVKFRWFPAQAAVLMCLRTNDTPSHAHIALPADEVRTFLEATREIARVTPEECDAMVDEFLKELFEA